jgi:hypothetical protein
LKGDLSEKLHRLNPAKLHVRYLAGTAQDILITPRRYTLTHSDMTGDLFLTVGNEYDKKQISGFYTRLMRDEVLAELVSQGNLLEYRVYCHISGGLTFGPARWRNQIFHAELPLVLEAFRYAERELFDKHTDLDVTPVQVYFKSTSPLFNRVEDWGKIGSYR